MEGEQEDPLILSDEESGCGSEVDDSLSCSSPWPPISPEPIIDSQEKLHFVVTALVVAASSSMVVITLPLYVEATSIESDVYCALVFTGSLATSFIVLLSLLHRLLCGTQSSSPPNIPLSRLFRVGGMMGMAGTVVLYSLGNKRVLCHLQDPILGVCLAFSLAFYFLFCEKAMGLQRIFSATTVIVGVFISVDYQLCNEFRCHGNDRVVSPTASPEYSSAWAWGSHLAWALTCAAGLALWALAYALLENDIVKGKAHFSPSSLATVSRLVATRDLDSRSPLLLTSSPVVTPEIGAVKPEESSLPNIWSSLGHSLTLATSLLAPQLLAVLALAWSAMFRPLSKASSPAEWWQLLATGLTCHISPSREGCLGIAVYGWMFALSYSALVLSSLHFLIQSESSVFTLACGSLALPIAGAWWSVFSSRDARLSWSPVFSGELVCSLLGLPVVLAGLGMLCRAHWLEARLRKLASSVSQPT